MGDCLERRKPSAQVFFSRESDSRIMYVHLSIFTFLSLFWLVVLDSETWQLTTRIELDNGVVQRKASLNSEFEIQNPGKYYGTKCLVVRLERCSSSCLKTSDKTINTVFVEDFLLQFIEYILHFLSWSNINLGWTKSNFISKMFAVLLRNECDFTNSGKSGPKKFIESFI